jgi:Rrf2 family protein
MFRVSRRLDYGIQLMTALAACTDGQLQPTAALAEKLEMPLPFMHQIAHVLMQSGLIRATPGQKGGLKLSQPPVNITVRQIAEALEGPITLSPCQDCDENCPRRDSCATFMIWNELQEKIVQHLESINLDMLCNNRDQIPGFALPVRFSNDYIPDVK